MSQDCSILFERTSFKFSYNLDLHSEQAALEI